MCCLDVYARLFSLISSYFSLYICIKEIERSIRVSALPEDFILYGTFWLGDHPSPAPFLQAAQRNIIKEEKGNKNK